MNVTRAIISDLWPQYVSGEASADTRALVEESVAADPDFARTLKESSGFALGFAAAPALPPDHEMTALTRIKRRLWGPLWLMQLAILFSASAFGRIVSDTSWDVSPRNFIITASIAGVLWVAFFVGLYRMRARILLLPGRPPRREA